MHAEASGEELLVFSGSGIQALKGKLKNATYEKLVQKYSSVGGAHGMCMLGRL